VAGGIMIDKDLYMDIDKLYEAEKHLLIAYGILHDIEIIFPEQRNAKDRLDESLWWLKKSIKLYFRKPGD
jgi:hypothetical protein